MTLECLVRVVINFHVIDVVRKFKPNSRGTGQRMTNGGELLRYRRRDRLLVFGKRPQFRDAAFVFGF